MRILSVLLMSAALVACSGNQKPSLNPGGLAPTAPPPQCAPTIKAPSLPEPPPPETGITAAILFDMVSSAAGEEKAKAWFRWFTVEHPEWGREGWQRIDQARAKPPCS